MLYQIGEQIVFLREKGGGIIRRIEKHLYYVEDDTGFERPFKNNEIAKVHGQSYSIPTNSADLIRIAEGGSSTKQSLKKSTKSSTSHWEIDLHLEKLMENYPLKINAINFNALEKQLAIFKDFFYKAKKQRVRKIIVIHGFGKGILRDELIHFLRGQQQIEFLDAPYIEYGHGAIQIDLYYKN